VWFPPFLLKWPRFSWLMKFPFFGFCYIGHVTFLFAWEKMRPHLLIFFSAYHSSTTSNFFFTRCICITNDADFSWINIISIRHCLSTSFILQLWEPLDMINTWQATIAVCFASMQEPEFRSISHPRVGLDRKTCRIHPVALFCAKFPIFMYFYLDSDNILRAIGFRSFFS